eukprot:ctg_901.g211
MGIRESVCRMGALGTPGRRLRGGQAGAGAREHHHGEPIIQSAYPFGGGDARVVGAGAQGARSQAAAGWARGGHRPCRAAAVSPNLPHLHLEAMGQTSRAAGRVGIGAHPGA